MTIHNSPSAANEPSRGTRHNSAQTSRADTLGDQSRWMTVLSDHDRLFTHVIPLVSVASTNTYCSDNMPEFGDTSPIVVTTNQTQGRGRQGRQWLSLPGEQLAVSYVVPTRISDNITATLVPLAAAVAVAKTAIILAQDPASISIKWPNDVLVGQRKLAGILVEVEPRSCRMIIGIGINIALSNRDFLRDHQQPIHRDASGRQIVRGADAESLDAIANDVVDPVRVCTILTSFVAQQVRRLVRESTHVLDDYTQLSSTIGTNVALASTVAQGGDTYTWTTLRVQSIDAIGRLCGYNMHDQWVCCDAGEIVHVR